MPEKAKRNSKPLDAMAALKKIRALRASQKDREAAIVRAVQEHDRKMIGKLFARVPVSEQDDLRAMLGALGIDVPVIDAEFEDPAVDDSDTGEEAAEAAEAPELPKGAQPLPPERAAIARSGARWK